jgi:hypothetical protein
VKYLKKGYQHLSSTYSVLDSRWSAIVQFKWAWKLPERLLDFQMISRILHTEMQWSPPFVWTVSVTDKQSMMTCGFFCSRPWLCYWILHSLAMLNQHYSSAVCNRSVDFLSRCQVSRLFPCPPPENCAKLLLHVGFKSCFLHEDPIDKSLEQMCR